MSYPDESGEIENEEANGKVEEAKDEENQDESEMEKDSKEELNKEEDIEDFVDGNISDWLEYWQKVLKTSLPQKKLLNKIYSLCVLIDPNGNGMMMEGWRWESKWTQTYFIFNPDLNLKHIAKIAKLPFSLLIVMSAA